MNETTDNALGVTPGTAPVNPLYGANPAPASHVADGAAHRMAHAADAATETGIYRETALDADSWREAPDPTLDPNGASAGDGGKRPGRGTNLLLVATLAAVCGLAGGLAGGAIMSAVSGGSAGDTQMAQGGGQQGGGTAPGGNGTSSSDSSSSDGASGNGAPGGQAPSGTGQDSSQDGGASSSAGSTAGEDSSSSDSSTGTDSSASQDSTSQTALSA